VLRTFWWRRDGLGWVYSGGLGKILRTVSVSVDVRQRSGGRRVGRRQAGHAHKVVRGCHQVARQLGAREPTVARAAEATDGFEPAEYFLDPVFSTVD
jgi:hypothetical protein